MYFPSNNWFVVRCNMVGIWQVKIIHFAAKEEF